MSRPDPIPVITLMSAQGLAPPGDHALAAMQRVFKRAARRAAARDAARADLPAPLPAASAFPEGRLSPRMLLLLARALDTRKETHVALMGTPLATLAAILMELKAAERPARITLYTPNPARAELTLDRLLTATHRDAVTVLEASATPTGAIAAERVLAWRSTAGLPEPPRPASEGLLLRAELNAARPGLLQETLAGDEPVRIDLSGVDPSRLNAAAPPDTWQRPTAPSRGRNGRDGAPVRRLLLVERMQQNAWRGHATSRVEAGVALAVKRLFEDAPEPPAGTPRHALARILLHLGYLEQVTATRRGAEALYLSSLDACETAEGWTFLGWARAQQGRLEDASDACEHAIRTDPTLGNPYNDLGAYRLSEGRRSEAKEWFGRATRAARYMAPHYPYTNLARIHYEEGDLGAAREAAEEALARMPGYRPAERLLKMLGGRDGSGTP